MNPRDRPPLPRRANDNNSSPDGSDIGAGILGGVAIAGLTYGIYKLFTSAGNTELETPLEDFRTSSHPSTLQVLEKITRKIGLDDDEIKAKNAIIKPITEKVIQYLKKGDELFNLLNKQIEWTGSYYEGLKIGDPDCFDINIVLTLPALINQKLNFAKETNYPRFIVINNFKYAVDNLKHQDTVLWGKMKNTIKWISDEDGYLLQDKIRQWFQSLLDRYVKPYIHEIHQNIRDVFNVTIHENGPGRTLKIRLRDNSLICINLVPVIKFGADILPGGFKSTDHAIYAVPKLKYEFNAMWRVSFCTAERAILHDLRAVKPAIRLLKKLRDTQQWHSLRSYHIKNLAIWEISKDRYLLKTMNLEQVFFHLFDKLFECMQNGTLLFYWNPITNLFGDMHPDTIINIRGRMNKIKTEFDQYRRNDPQNIEKLICPDTTDQPTQFLGHWDWQ